MLGDADTAHINCAHQGWIGTRCELTSISRGAQLMIKRGGVTAIL
jgi:hypothetical protein